MEKRYNLNVMAFKPTNVVVREATPVDEFHFDKCISEEDGSEAVIVSNPLYVIFNNQRLSQLGNTSLQMWIDSMNQVKSDSLKELRSKLTDEQLVDMLRSRYCQKPQELANWAAYITNNMDKFEFEVKQYMEAQQAQQTDVASTEKTVVETKSE